MTKLYEVLRLELPKGDVGIEIECEGEGIKEVNRGFWKTERDGSLRGNYPDQCCEFVLAAPIPFKDVEKAIDALIKEQAEAKFEFSYRTSVHVHINCLNMTSKQVSAFAYTYLLFEKVLMRYCGEHRNNNRFCLRVRDAEDQLRAVMNVVTQGFNALYDLHGDYYRYASLNMASLAKYGSLEFRGMRGTLDKEVLTTWVSVLWRIREYALQMGSPMAVYERIGAIGFDEFFNEVLGEFKATFFYDYLQDLAESISLTIEIPFEFRRVEKAKQALAQPKKKEVKQERFRIDPNGLLRPGAIIGDVANAVNVRVNNNPNGEF